MLFLNENAAIVKEIPAFQSAFTAAKATFDAITQSEQRRQQKSSRVTASREQLHENLANQANAMASIIGGYATNTKDSGLLESVNFSPSELFYARGPILLSRSANLLEQAKQLAAPLVEYGVSDALLVNFATMVEQYSTLVHGPREEKAERKVAGQDIKDLLKELDTVFNNLLDAFVLQYRDTNRIFYNQYQVMRFIQQPAQRKTRLEGLVVEKETRDALAQVDIRIKDTELQVQTAADGSYNLRMPLLTGVIVQFSKKGYKTVELPIVLRRGKALKVAVELERE